MTKEKITLLESARLINSKKTQKKYIDEERMDLALAWIKEEINLHQMQIVLDAKSLTNVYAFLSRCFKVYVLEDYKGKNKK
jgi:hypothetical protein